jgi:hypothetical protein
MSLFEIFDDLHYFRDVLTRECIATCLDETLFDERECMTDMLGRDLTIDDVLFEEGERVTESTTSSFCDDFYRFWFSLDLFRFCDVFESRDDVIEGDFSEVKPQSTRPDRLWDFIDLGRREDELHMCGWLFECFEKRIKCSRRKHMDFVDNIDFIFSLIWLKSCLLDQFSYIFYSVIACTIDLDDIEHGIRVKRLTILTCMTRVTLSGTTTVQGLCEDTSARRLSSSARAMKEIGMTDTSRLETVSEYRRDVVLAHD